MADWLAWCDALWHVFGITAIFLKNENEMHDTLKGLQVIPLLTISLLLLFIIGCNNDSTKSETTQQTLYRQWKNDCLSTIDSFYITNRGQYDSVQLKREIFASRLNINFIDSTTFYFLYEWLQNYVGITEKDSPNTFSKIHILRRHRQGGVSVQEFAIIFANDTLCKGFNYKHKPFIAEITYLRHDSYKLDNLVRSIDNQYQSRDKRYNDFIIFSSIEGANIHTRLLERQDSTLGATIDNFLYQEEE